MTIQRFTKLAEAYFGEYRPLVKGEVAEELRDWDPESIDELWAEMRRNRDTSFKTPPDVFAIVHSDAQLARLARSRRARIESRTRMLSAPADTPDDVAAESFADILRKWENGLRGVQ